MLCTSPPLFRPHFLHKMIFRKKTTILMVQVLVSDKAGDIGSPVLKGGTINALLKHQRSFICGSTSVQVKSKIPEEIWLEERSGKEAIYAPWGTLPRKTSKFYFAMRVIERFEEANNRNPGDLLFKDVSAILRLKRHLCEAHAVSEALIPDVLLEILLKGSIVYPNPLGCEKEVIKAISGEGDPLNNFVYFDIVNWKGVVEDISTRAPETELK
ncbi:SUMO-activating enzyme subunit 1A [Linum perenne]